MKGVGIREREKRRRVDRTRDRTLRRRVLCLLRWWEKAGVGGDVSLFSFAGYSPLKEEDGIVGQICWKEERRLHIAVEACQRGNGSISSLRLGLKSIYLLIGFGPSFDVSYHLFLFCLFVSFGLHEMNNAVHTLLQLANYFPLNGPFFFVHVLLLICWVSIDWCQNSAGLWFGAAYRSFCTQCYADRFTQCTQCVFWWRLAYNKLIK